MLEQVLRHLNNWFLVDIHEGTFTVENGSIALPFLQTNQYFRICSSVFNDGLHLYPAVDLTDETFTGRCGRWRCQRLWLRLPKISPRGKKRTAKPLQTRIKARASGAILTPNAAREATAAR